MRLISFAAALAAVVLLMATALPATAAVEQVVSGLTQPVRLVAPQDDPRLFIVQRNGVIRVFDQLGAEQDTLLDIRWQTTTFSERGLLGLAFAPDFTTSGRFYINFTDLQGDTRLARYQVGSSNPAVADTTTREIILTVDQPFENHNGGHLEFGPDGMLYVGLGDGGSGGDPQNRAQNPQALLGKMLRLDVSPATGYAIPSGNPFIGQPPRDEIWALGLRNPWCFSFDRQTGDLYIADVGQELEEEIDVQPAASPGGQNYGWRLMEGTLCYLPRTNCDDGTLTAPVYTYGHGGSPFRCSISGGYVYRGSRLPSLAGHYFFADYCSRQVWTLTWNPLTGSGPVANRTAEMTPPGGYGSLASFGQDGLGELYILDTTRGRVYRIVSATSDQPPAAPAVRLAQNVPNPFNPGTAISFTVPAGGAEVLLEVFDAAGRLVRTLAATTLPEGTQQVFWDGTDDRGRRVQAGIYFYRYTSGATVLSRKMTLLK